MSQASYHQGLLNTLIAHARRHPHRPALMAEGTGVISLSHLLRRAALLARNIRRSRREFIGLTFKKNPDFVTAILATWLAGKAYVPMDPRWPKERIDGIIHQIGLDLVLTEEWDVPSDAITHEKIPDPIHFQPESPAYLIYSSGSTGNPKGVVIPHRGLMPVLTEQARFFKLTTKSRTLQYLNYAFDAALSGIGTALLSGSPLCIAKEEHLTPSELPETILRMGITHVDLPPSLLPFLPVEQMPPTLKTVIVGGEICPPHIIRIWSKKFRLINAYGPTENTICSSLKLMHPGTSPGAIGRPIRQTFMKVANTGELMIGGQGLFTRYWDDGLQTKLRLLRIGSRTYFRTGDKVRLMRNGEFEFLGRLDRQIKIGGKLVCPEEIEKTLLSHPQLAQAAVTSHSLTVAGGIHKTILVAHLAGLKKNLSKKSVRSWLQKKLPARMIPAQIHVVKRLPRLLHEKLDLAKLQKKPVSSPLAELLTRIRPDIPVSIHDDLTEIGFDSLDIMNLVVQAEAIGIRLSPEDVYRHRCLKNIVHSIQDPLHIHPSILSTQDLEKRTRLDVALTRRLQSQSPSREKMQNILLTGATGFLGCHLLRQLMKQTSADIYCLVRRRANVSAQKRLKELTKRLALPQNATRRIHLIEGDLDRPHLGIRGGDWSFLEKHIDTVFHNAARVNLALPMNELMAVHVEAARDAVDLVSRGIHKRMIYVSTLSVAVATDTRRKLIAEAPLNTKENGRNYKVYGGYAQSKWVSEKLVQNAIDAGCPNLLIVRPGLLTGSPRYPALPPTDLLAHFLHGLSQLKIYPEHFPKNLAMDMTPVDIAATQMVRLSLQPSAYSQIHHIANEQALHLTTLIQWMQGAGVVLQPVRFAEWKKQTAQLDLLDGSDPAMAVLALNRVFRPRDRLHTLKGLDLFAATGKKFAMRQPICPPITQSWFHSILKGVLS